MTCHMSRWDDPLLGPENQRECVVQLLYHGKNPRTLLQEGQVRRRRLQGARERQEWQARHPGYLTVAEAADRAGIVRAYGYQYFRERGWLEWIDGRYAVKQARLKGGRDD